MTGRERRWRPSLRARVTLVAAAVVIFLVAITGVLVLRGSRSALERSLDAQVDGVARDVAGQLLAGAEPPAVALRAGAGPFPTPAVQVRRLDGSLLAAIGPAFTIEFGQAPLTLQDVEPAISLTPPPTPPAPPGPPRVDLPRLAHQLSWSVARVEVRRTGDDLVVYAGSPYRVVDDVLGPLEDRLRVAVPVVGLLAAVLAHVLVRRSLQPVDAIRAEADAVTETSLARRVPDPGTDDEIGRLAATFNRMLARLDAAQRRQRQFVSDASHELRSPVAALRSSLEVAAAHPESTDWSRTTEDLLALTARLEHLVDDLLMLARQDELEPASLAQEVDLDEVVRNQARLPRPAPVLVSELRPTRVSGSGRDLERMVANLLDNATRFATDKVEVALVHDDGAAVLHVDDDGPGVPPEERERVFERFVRLDHGRGRAAGGAGLGLAVVRETVVRHGGTVTATASPLGGARFTVRLGRH